MDPFGLAPAGAFGPDLADALEDAPIGAVMLDEAFTILYRNRRIAEILGVEGEGVTEAVMGILSGPILARGMDDRVVAVDAVRPDGERRALHLSFATAPYGMADAMVVWVYDVTELQRARAAAERAAHARSAFLATMSHEIRTPMNGVATMADLLVATALDGDQREMVDTIRSSAEAMLAILDDVLDAAKIDAGRLETEDRPYQPAAVLDGAAAILRPRAREKGLAFTVALEDGVPAWVRGDGVRVRQILLNLAGNALKFTEHGHVAMRVTVPAPGRLRAEVEDTGIGISGEQRLALFQPFSQVDASIARRFGGSGLGLSICRGLVDLMDGTIGVESTPGVGSLFWFEIAAPACAAPPPPPAAIAGGTLADAWTAPAEDAAAAARAVVLCVEDDPTNRLVLRRVLARLGVVHDVAVDAAEALARLDRSRHGMVLTDLHMPGMDGCALARAIGGDTLPILALSADTVKGTAEACQEAGMVGHLSKPIRIDALEAALARHLPVAHRLRRPAAPPPATAAVPRQPAAPVLPIPVPGRLRELVGDDPEAVRAALDGFLESASGLVAGLEDAMARGERAAAMAAAHTLKSSSLLVGADALSALSAAVEGLLHEGGDPAALIAPVRTAFEAWAAPLRPAG